MSNLIVAIGAVLLSAIGFAGLLILLILLNPEKVQLWISWIYRGARLVLKKAEYGAVAYDVGGHLTAFYNKEVVPMIEGLPKTQVKVAWANSPEAVASLREGTLIVRLRPNEERVSNIFAASMAAMPMLVAPTVRHDLRKEQSKAIDVQLCRKLAERLGTPGAVAFRAEVLEPLVRDTPPIRAIIEDLQAIDVGGLFVAVFLQELTSIGRTNQLGKAPGLDAEVDNFIAFLKNIAERQRGEDVDLSFIGAYIRTNILLVAHADKRSAGVAPFFNRIGIELGKGVETVYVMATEWNFTIVDKLVAALDADMRLMKRREHTLQIVRAGNEVTARIVPFDRNPGYSPQKLFEAAANDRGLRVGFRTTVTITDSQPQYALADLDGLQAQIPRREADWGFVEDVSDILAPGEEVEVEVISIDAKKGEVQLSRKRCIDNPIGVVDLRGRRGTFTPTGPIALLHDVQLLFGTFQSENRTIPAALSQTEIEWGSEGASLDQFYGDDAFDVVVVDVWKNDGIAIVSRKRAAANQWPEIRDKYRRDASLRVPVTAVAVEGVYCEIEPGLVGFVPEDEFRIAGFEMAEYRTNLKPGQFLHAYVRNVIGGTRQRVTLGLERNRRR